MWGVDNPDDDAAAQEGIARTEEYFKEIGMPTCFTALGIGVQPDDAIEQMADFCTHHGKRLVGSFRKLDKNDICAIYQSANH